MNVKLEREATLLRMLKEIHVSTRSGFLAPSKYGAMRAKAVTSQNQTKLDGEHLIGSAQLVQSWRWSTLSSKYLSYCMRKSNDDPANQRQSWKVRDHRS